MKSLFIPILLFSSLTAFTQTPTLSHVFDIKAEIGDAINGGPNPHGIRVTIPITGGTVTGKVNGHIVPGGADYQIVNPDQHRSELQAIYTIMTNDSVVIRVCNEGINSFAPDDSYFMTSPKFECDINSPYDWLNNRIFICRPVDFAPSAITLRVWMAE
ncbi:MAG: DUF3237 domain-containing protein [Muribaculaceae bacterium]|nr:DUF3237 domain-containing protein [Muribaculaceae bacterium]